jgi:hypothetical protein
LETNAICTHATYSLRLGKGGRITYPVAAGIGWRGTAAVAATAVSVVVWVAVAGSETAAVTEKSNGLHTFCSETDTPIAKLGILLLKLTHGQQDYKS